MKSHASLYIESSLSYRIISPTRCPQFKRLSVDGCGKSAAYISTKVDHHVKVLVFHHCFGTKNCK